MPNNKKYDFSGWATRNNIRCSDRRIILKDAFKEQNGAVVPLVWSHNHDDVDCVLGHCLLENRDEGVYAYCTFNSNPKSQNAKEMVVHGDIKALSIYANQLKQNGDEVVHGKIKEVSLVLAGANMGAYIDTVIAHSDTQDEEAVIYHEYEDSDLELYHEDSAANKDEENETVEDIFNKMTDKQKLAVYAIVGAAVDAAKKEEDTDVSKENNKNKEDNEKMKHNLFEGTKEAANLATLQHSALIEIRDLAKKNGGSVKDAYDEYVKNFAIQHADDELAHGITNVGYLFPDYKDALSEPDAIKRDTGWVGTVMNSVHKLKFARVRSRHIDITADEARAKGFVKGNQKADEVVVALKRTTDPQTVYKKQAMDRDDIIDITDFDAVAWLKGEMRLMLDEEIARAILIGDGRSADSNDKIDPTHIRPILGDSSTYVTAKTITKADSDTNATFYKKFIDEIIRSRKNYKGSGNPYFWTTEDDLTEMLLIEDSNGRKIYTNETELATALRVKGIVTVPVMENCVRTSGGYDYTCLGIIANLVDYGLGADRGGQVTMFDDFDINYNKERYLIETRVSGALIKPYSAITFELKTTHVEG